jgi:hypothetical protein
VTNPNARQYICPRCGQTIDQAQLVVFDVGEFVHHPCFIQAGGGLDLVAAFLRQQAPAPFCHGCLTTSLQISYQDVQRAVTILRLSGEFQVLVGQQCSGCRRQRVTVGVVHTQAQSGS